MTGESKPLFVIQPFCRDRNLCVPCRTNPTFADGWAERYEMPPGWPQCPYRVPDSVAQPEHLPILLAEWRTPPYRGDNGQRGIVMPAGGAQYLTNAYASIRVARHLGCDLPFELWHLGPDERIDYFTPLFKRLGNVRWVDALALGFEHQNSGGLTYAGHTAYSGHPGTADGYALKAFALAHTSFVEVIVEDADNPPNRDPAFLFDDPDYRRTGALFWLDADFRTLPDSAWRWIVGREPDSEQSEHESGQMVVDRKRSWPAVALAWRLNQLRQAVYQILWGDKDTFTCAWLRTGLAFATVTTRPVKQLGPDGRLIAYKQSAPDGESTAFVHRIGWGKLDPDRPVPVAPDFDHHQVLEEAMGEVRRARPARGLGDLVAKGLEAVGITKTLVETLTGKPCNCPDRQAWLNRRVPIVRHLRERPAVVTMWTPEWQTLADLVMPRIEEWVSKQNYALYFARDRVDPSRHPVWSMLPLVMEGLARHRTVLKLDIDAVPVDPLVTLDGLIHRSADVVWRADHNGPNFGIALLRSNKRVMDWLNTAWLSYETYQNHPFREQQALVDLARGTFRRQLSVVEVQATELNAYPEDLGVTPLRFFHVPGHPLSEKLKLLSDFLKCRSPLPQPSPV